MDKLPTKSELQALICDADSENLRRALHAVIHFRPADDDIIPPHGVKEHLHSGSYESHQAAKDYNRHATEVYCAIKLALTSRG